MLLPDPIRQIETDSGVKLVFPWREIPGPLRKQINFFLELGGLVSLFAAGMLAWAIFDGAERRNAPALVGFVICVLGAAFAFGYAVCLMWTRSIVDYDPEGLQLVEQQGLIRRKRTRKWRNVARLATHHLVHSSDQLGDPRSTIGVLEVVGAGAQTLWFAHDYPRDWLLAVGSAIANVGRVPHVNIPPSGTLDARFKPFLISDVEDENTIDVEEEPTGSRIAIARFSDGVRVTVPPARIPAQGWIVVAAAAVLIVCAIFQWIGRIAENGGFNPEAFAPVAIISGLVLIVGGVIWINSRTVEFWITPHRFAAITTRKLFGTWPQDWPRSQIAAIRCDLVVEAGSKGEYLGLLIRLADSESCSFLSGRDPAELRWLATVLRRELGVPAVVSSIAP